MKELDLMLAGWVTAEFERASPSLRAHFALLLDLPDPDLVAYLLGGVRPQDADLLEAVDSVLAPRSIMSSAVVVEPSDAPPL